MNQLILIFLISIGFAASGNVSLKYKYKMGGTNKSNQLPSEVKTFIERRDNCDHFRGEEASDEVRKKELIAALEKYCKGTDADLKQLRSKYSNNPKIRSVLKKYEENIE